MRLSDFRPVMLTVCVSALTACATGPGGGSIYVPVDGRDEMDQAPEPPSVQTEQQEPRVHRKSEQPDVERSAPSYQEQGDALSPAARSLVEKADQLMRQGDAAGAIAQLERAQRIAPRSAAVYFGLSEAYVAQGQLGSAEQFALKGLSLSGSDTGLQRAGWLLLADIRQARGNVAGANQARTRAEQL